MFSVSPAPEERGGEAPRSLDRPRLPLAHPAEETTALQVSPPDKRSLGGFTSASHGGESPLWGHRRLPSWQGLVGTQPRQATRTAAHHLVTQLGLLIREHRVPQSSPWAELGDAHPLPMDGGSRGGDDAASRWPLEVWRHPAGGAEPLSGHLFSLADDELWVPSIQRKGEVLEKPHTKDGWIRPPHREVAQGQGSRGGRSPDKNRYKGI